MPTHSTTDAAIRDVVSNIKAKGVANAADYGVRSGTRDNTVELANIAALVTSKNPGSRVAVDLPGGVVRGHLPMVPWLVWRLNGTDFRFPNAGPAGHMVRPYDPAWIDTNAIPYGAGAHMSGLAGSGQFHGETSRWGVNFMPEGPRPTLTRTTGTIPAGTVGYRIAYKTAWGIGRATDARTNVTLDAAGGVTLEWANHADAAGAEIVIYGRYPWGIIECQRLAVLPAGTTTWTDNGSVTPFGRPAHLYDLSAPSGVLMTGGGWDVAGQHLLVTDIPGQCFVSEWTAGSIPDMAWSAGMEARCWGLRLQTHNDIPSAGGFSFNGPHDSRHGNLYPAGGFGWQATGYREAIHVASPGPCEIEGGHAWGSSNFAVRDDGGTKIVGFIAEGGRKGQYAMRNDEGSIIGGAAFPGFTTTESPSVVGVQIGSEEWACSATVTDILLGCNISEAVNFTASTGAAVDLTHAAAGTSVTGKALMRTGSLVTGFDSAKHSVQIGARDIPSFSSGLASGSVQRVERVPASAYAALTPAERQDPAVMWVVQPETVDDAFTGTDGAALGSLWATSGTNASTATIQAGKARLRVGAAGNWSDRIIVASTTPARADGGVRFTVTPTDTTKESYFYVLLRAQGSGAPGVWTGAHYRLNIGRTGSTWFSRYDGSTDAQIGGTAGFDISGWGSNVPATIEVEINGSTLTARGYTGTRPTSPQLTVTDSTITTAGRTGLVLGGGGTAQNVDWLVDDWSRTPMAVNTDPILAGTGGESTVTPPATGGETTTTTITAASDVALSAGV